MLSKTAYKRMIVCCDGTWQASDKSAGGSMDSNVTKFSRALSKTVDIKGHTVQQIVYYASGIGTDGLTRLSHYVAGGLGLGLADNVIEAYNFLALNHDPGDEIFLFGFSRGAYTVRALAGLISKAGIIDRGSLEHSAGLYRAYQGGGVALDKFMKEFQLLYKKGEPNIKVVGCWDTVGSLGIPKTWLTWFTQANNHDAFFDTSLSTKIENAFHALALDEHRNPFSPTLWHLPIGSKTNLVQCWFPGVHISSGGGSNRSSNDEPGRPTEQLADITFAWMVEMCQPFLEFDSTFIANHRNLFVLEEGEPEWGLGEIHDSYAWYYRPLYSLTRSPGQYNPDKKNVADPDYVAQRSREYMHSTVRIREGFHKRSDALGGFDLVPDLDARKPGTDAGKDGLRSGWKWVKQLGNGGIVEIPEMKILGGGEWSAELDLMPKEAQIRVRKGTKGEDAGLSLLD